MTTLSANTTTAISLPASTVIRGTGAARMSWGNPLQTDARQAGNEWLFGPFASDQTVSLHAVSAVTYSTQAVSDDDPVDKLGLRVDNSLTAAQVQALQDNPPALLYTWATLPAPGDYIGTAYVSDIGLHGSLWRSDGSTWGLVGGSVVLDRSAVALSALTGSTSLTTLLTRSMPASLPGLNGAYRLRGKVSTTNNANIKTLFAYIGPNAATGIGYFSQAGGGFDILIENRGSASSQIGSNGTPSGMGGGAWTTGLAINTAAAHDLTLRGQLANSADSLVIEAWQLELYRP